MPIRALADRLILALAALVVALAARVLSVVVMLVAVDYCRHRIDMAVPYEYDFGDGWEHELTLEAILPRQAGQKYPICVCG